MTAAIDPVAETLAQRFVTRYDDVMRQPWVEPFYEASGFFNTGYWEPGVTSPKAACERLVETLAGQLPAAPAALLDVGCGYGATTLAFARRFPSTRLTGVNLSPQQIERARQTLPPEISLRVMDAAQLDLPAAAFDAVVSVEAAFHFLTREAFFAEAARVLCRGGRLVLSDILYRDVSVVGGWLVPAQNRITKLDTYAAQLRLAGFEDVEVIDATRECWAGFCASLRRFFLGQRDAGLIDEPAFLGLDQLVHRLESCVAHYVIAAATRRED